MKKLDEYLVKTGWALEIYDHDLALKLYGMSLGKIGNLERIAMLVQMLPEQIIDGDKITTKIYYPLCTPDLAGIETHYPTLDATTLKEKANEIIETIKNNSERCILDLNDAQQLSQVLVTERMIIERLRKLRLELATFIKDNIPIEKVLAT